MNPLRRLIRVGRGLVFDHWKRSIAAGPVTVRGIPLYLNPYDSVVCRKLYVRRSWEPLEAREIARRAEVGSVALDIGAHIGFYECLMSSRVGPSGTVYAFEPNSENFGFLERNARARPNVIAEHTAVSDITGEITLYLSETHKGDHRIWDPGASDERRPVASRSVTLTDYCHAHAIDPSRVSVVKVDTQGAEPGVLAGARPLIDSMPNATWFVEFWPGAYEAQPNLDGRAFSDELWRTFEILDLNYVLGTLEEIESRDHLQALFESHLKWGNGVDHSTLVMRPRR